MNTSVLECFDNVYIPDEVKTALSNHGLRNIELIACVRTGQKCNQSPQTSMMLLWTKIVRNVSLKALTILVKSLILDARLGPGHASAD